jgi:hypothetical protein
MKNWIRQKLHNFIFSAHDGELATEIKSHRKNALVTRGGSHLDSRGMNFTIHQANGGFVLEYSVYNEKTDRHEHALHIITSDTDLGQGLAHIITLELLRR